LSELNILVIDNSACYRRRNYKI